MRTLAAILFLLISINCFSVEGPDDIVIIEKEDVITDTNGGNPKPKTPSRPLQLFLSDNMISWNETESVEYVQILDTTAEILLFSYEVSTEDTFVNIPSYVQGDVILRLYNGNVWYRGIITL